jgi:hypothetical protein
MRKFAYVLIGLALSAVLPSVPLNAQDAADDNGGGYQEIVVTAYQRSSYGGPASAVLPPPVIGLKRQADSAVRTISIVSDSREEGMRKREVQAMLFAALDRAKQNGFALVTGQFELVEINRENWKDQFPGLDIKSEIVEDEDDDDDEDENKPPPAFEDDGNTTTIRLKVKTKLDGSIGNAQQKINSFVKSVPATGRSLIEQQGSLALTIINPEQYRDPIYQKVAAGAKHAAIFYGADYGLDVTGLDKAIAWKQVSNTEVFLYIPYQFVIDK